MTPSQDGWQSVYSGRIYTFPEGPEKQALERRARLMRRVLVVATVAFYGWLILR